jgi:hypothetical protein
MRAVFATRVPGAARRLWRDRPRLVAVGLLALTAIAASGLQSTSAIVLQQTLDESWRGTYDILVTQRGKDPVTSGFLRSDSLVDASMGRLGLDDLALIRGLPGVDVAAPIALVSFAETDLVGDPLVWLPMPVRADASLENPQAFRVTVRSETDDGTGPHDLARQTVLAFAYQPSFSQVVFDTNGAPLIGPDGQIVYATHALADSPRLLSGDSRITFSGGAWDASTGTIPLGLSLAPRPAANIALVEPEAERQLLGDAGAFLDPLLEPVEDGRLPLVVSDRARAVVRLSVTVEEFDEVTPGAAGAEAVAQAQGTGFLQNGQIAPTIAADATTTVIGSFDADAAPSLDPYTHDLLLLGNIEQRLVDATRNAALAPGGPGPRSVLGSRYTIPEDAASTGTGVRLHPRGYAAYGVFAEAPLSGGAPAGSVTEYEKLFGAVGTGGTAGQTPLTDRFEVVGTYHPDELRAGVGDVSFMPLGAYDVVNPSLVAGPDDEPMAPVDLATSITGFGIPGTNDMAVGSLDILEGLGVDRPISAIRIRVQGIDRYTVDAQQKLLAAASGLEQLGFEATIVAGSSPQQMRVLVGDYSLAATDDRGLQEIADLGYVDQEWSRLGAVIEAEAAVSATSIALLAVSILSVGVLLSVVQLGSIPGRRAQAGVLRQLGWRRRRIARWFLAEEAVALLAVALVGAAAVALATVPGVASVSVALSIALVVVTSLAAVIAGARAPRHTTRRQRALRADLPPRVPGPIAFGRRLASTQVANSVSLGLAMMLVTIAVAIGATVFVQGRELAGPSAIGAVASARAWLPQGLLAAATLAAGITLAVLSRRMGVERKRDQWAAIRAMGWTTRDVTRAHLAELAFSAVPGIVVGVGLAAGIAVQVPGLTVAVLLVSTAGGLVALAMVLFSGRRLD